MVTRLEARYKDEPPLLFFLKNARQFLKEGNSELAIVTVEKILMDQTVSQDIKIAHSQIVKDAKALGLAFIVQEKEMQNQSGFFADHMFSPDLSINSEPIENDLTKSLDFSSIQSSKYDPTRILKFGSPFKN